MDASSHRSHLPWNGLVTGAAAPAGCIALDAVTAAGAARHQSQAQTTSLLAESFLQALGRDAKDTEFSKAFKAFNFKGMVVW